MLCVVGFPAAPEGARQHRPVRRQRSLLSESLQTSPAHAFAQRLCSRDSLDSQGSCEGWSDAEQEDCSLSSSQPQSPASGWCSPSARPLEIVYSKAARDRIDRAEAQGKARDEQLEMLHAVRQYMAVQHAEVAAQQRAQQRAS